MKKHLYVPVDLQKIPLRRAPRVAGRGGRDRLGAGSGRYRRHDRNRIIDNASVAAASLIRRPVSNAGPMRSRIRTRRIRRSSIGALEGPLHGGANEAVMHGMLDSCGSCSSRVGRSVARADDAHPTPTIQQALDGMMTDGSGAARADYR